MRFRDFKEIIRQGDSQRVVECLEQQPDLLHFQDLEPEHWEERTALHSAARHGHLDLVKLLVERGAEVYSHPCNSYPAVFVACQDGPTANQPETQPVVDYFVNEIPDRAEGTLGLGATIHIAARLGFKDVVRKHLELDPLSVHQRGWLGDTPLHWSCHNGHEEIVRMLLDAGADIEADEINCYGGKPLHWASEHETHIVRLLLERGAKVDSLNGRRESEYFGVTPLLMNAYQRDDCWQATELLLQNGANISATHRGRTALEIARGKGNRQIEGVLTRWGEAPGDPLRVPSSDSAGVSGVASDNRHVTLERVTQIPRPPHRPAEGHKGTFGNVLVVAGSLGMSGAASLAGQAALHAGAGLVTVATARSASSTVAAAHSSYMTIALDEDESGVLAESALLAIERSCQYQTALALGPGLGQSQAVIQIIKRLYRHVALPLVLDADGLNAFVGSCEQLANRSHSAPRVLTPHVGEFSRLVGKDKSEIEAQRESLAVQFAREHHVILLLKGQGTIITDGNRIAINRTGNTALSTGGSGDVLTGIIASLLAQGVESFDAAQLGAYVHGLAGEAVAERYGARFSTSTEILEQMATAWQRLDLPS